MRESKVLIIMPAFNEGMAIRKLIGQTKKLYPNIPILVINDGSHDNTAREAETAGARIVSLPYNLGIGGAVQTGYKVAFDENFDVAVQIDGDGQHDPRFLMDIVKPVLSEKASLCIGSRFLEESSSFRSTFMRRIGIVFFSKLLSQLTGTKLTDPTSGFRAADKKLIRAFADHYPIDFPEPETIQMTKRLGMRICEVPVKMRKRLGGRSSIRYWATAYYMIKVTLAILIDTLRKKT